MAWSSVELPVWLRIASLPLGALAFRRGWVVVLAIGVLPLSQPAEASLWDDLWLNESLTTWMTDVVVRAPADEGLAEGRPRPPR